MDQAEAQAILAEQLARFGSYVELLPLVAAQRGETWQVRGARGADYQIEIQCFWDDYAGGDIRVLGSIDAGGWRAFLPLTKDVLVSRPKGLASAAKP